MVKGAALVSPLRKKYSLHFLKAFFKNRSIILQNFMAYPYNPIQVSDLRS